MKIISTKILIYLFALSSFSIHKYYISITHIKHVPKQETIQVILRVFIDDLQEELHQLNQSKIELGTNREPKNIDFIYEEYINDNFSININKKKQNLTYLGKSYTDDMVVFYIEIINVKDIKELKIVNNILYSSFPEQENIVKVNINNQHKSYILYKNHSIALINY
jgi:hypothetical protein